MEPFQMPFRTPDGRTPLQSLADEYNVPLNERGEIDYEKMRRSLLPPQQPQQPQQAQQPQHSPEVIAATRRELAREAALKEIQREGTDFSIAPNVSRDGVVETLPDINTPGSFWLQKERIGSPGEDDVGIEDWLTVGMPRVTTPGGAVEHYGKFITDRPTVAGFEVTKSRDQGDVITDDDLNKMLIRAANENHPVFGIDFTIDPNEFKDQYKAHALAKAILDRTREDKSDWGDVDKENYGKVFRNMTPKQQQMFITAMDSMAEDKSIDVGWWSRAIDSLQSGLGQVAEMGEGVAGLLGSKTDEQVAGEQLEQDAKSLVAAKKAEAGMIMGGVNVALEILPAMATGGGVGGVAGKAALAGGLSKAASGRVAKGAAMGFWFDQTVGSVKDRLRQNGLNDTEASIYALPSAAAIAAVELIQVKGFLKGAKMNPKSMMSRVATNTSSFKDKMIKNSVARAATGAVKTGAIESGQESFQQALEEGTMFLAHNFHGSDFDSGESFENIKSAFTDSFLAMTIIGAPGSTIKTINEKRGVERLRTKIAVADAAIKERVDELIAGANASQNPEEFDKLLSWINNPERTNEEFADIFAEAEKRTDGLEVFGPKEMADFMGAGLFPTIVEALEKNKEAIVGGRSDALDYVNQSLSFAGENRRHQARAQGIADILFNYYDKNPELADRLADLITDNKFSRKAFQDFVLSDPNTFRKDGSINTDNDSGRMVADLLDFMGGELEPGEFTINSTGETAALTPANLFKLSEADLNAWISEQAEVPGTYTTGEGMTPAQERLNLIRQFFPDKELFIPDNLFKLDNQNAQQRKIFLRVMQKNMAAWLAAKPQAVQAEAEPAAVEAPPVVEQEAQQEAEVEGEVGVDFLYDVKGNRVPIEVTDRNEDGTIVRYRLEDGTEGTSDATSGHGNNPLSMKDITSPDYELEGVGGAPKISTIPTADLEVILENREQKFEETKHVWGREGAPLFALKTINAIKAELNRREQAETQQPAAVEAQQEAVLDQEGIERVSSTIGDMLDAYGEVDFEEEFFELIDTASGQGDAAIEAQRELLNMMSQLSEGKTVDFAAHDWEPVPEQQLEAEGLGKKFNRLVGMGILDNATVLSPSDIRDFGLDPEATIRAIAEANMRIAQGEELGINELTDIIYEKHTGKEIDFQRKQREGVAPAGVLRKTLGEEAYKGVREERAAGKEGVVTVPKSEITKGEFVFSEPGKRKIGQVGKATMEGVIEPPKPIRGDRMAPVEEVPAEQAAPQEGRLPDAAIPEGGLIIPETLRKQGFNSFEDFLAAADGNEAQAKDLMETLGVKRLKQVDDRAAKVEEIDIEAVRTYEKIGNLKDEAEEAAKRGDNSRVMEIYTELEGLEKTLKSQLDKKVEKATDPKIKDYWRGVKSGQIDPIEDPPKELRPQKRKKPKAKIKRLFNSGNAARDRKLESNLSEYTGEDANEFIKAIAEITKDFDVAETIVNKLPLATGEGVQDRLNNVIEEINNKLEKPLFKKVKGKYVHDNSPLTEEEAVAPVTDKTKEYESEIEAQPKWSEITPDERLARLHEGVRLVNIQLTRAGIPKVNPDDLNLLSVSADEDFTGGPIGRSAYKTDAADRVAIAEIYFDHAGGEGSGTFVADITKNSELDSEGYRKAVATVMPPEAWAEAVGDKSGKKKIKEQHEKIITEVIEAGLDHIISPKVRSYYSGPNGPFTTFSVEAELSGEELLTISAKYEEELDEYVDGILDELEGSLGLSDYYDESTGLVDMKAVGPVADRFADKLEEKYPDVDNIRDIAASYFLDRIPDAVFQRVMQLRTQEAIGEVDTTDPDITPKSNVSMAHWNIADDANVDPGDRYRPLTSLDDDAMFIGRDGKPYKLMDFATEESQAESEDSNLEGNNWRNLPAADTDLDIDRILEVAPGLEWVGVQKNRVHVFRGAEGMDLYMRAVKFIPLDPKNVKGYGDMAKAQAEFEATGVSQTLGVHVWLPGEKESHSILISEMGLVSPLDEDGGVELEEIIHWAQTTGRWGPEINELLQKEFSTQALEAGLEQADFLEDTAKGFAIAITKAMKERDPKSVGQVRSILKKILDWFNDLLVANGFKEMNVDYVVSKWLSGDMISKPESLTMQRGVMQRYFSKKRKFPLTQEQREFARMDAEEIPGMRAGLGLNELQDSARELAESAKESDMLSRMSRLARVKRKLGQQVQKLGEIWDSTADPEQRGRGKKRVSGAWTSLKAGLRSAFFVVPLENRAAAKKLMELTEAQEGFVNKEVALANRLLKEIESIVKNKLGVDRMSESLRRVIQEAFVDATARELLAERLSTEITDDRLRAEVMEALHDVSTKLEELRSRVDALSEMIRDDSVSTSERMAITIDTNLGVYISRKYLLFEQHEARSDFLLNTEEGERLILDAAKEVRLKSYLHELKKAIELERKKWRDGVSGSYKAEKAKEINKNILNGMYEGTVLADMGAEAIFDHQLEEALKRYLETPKVRERIEKRAKSRMISEEKAKNEVRTYVTQAGSGKPKSGLAKNMDSLLERKNLPQAFMNLYGEIRGTEMIGLTVQNMASSIATNEFQKAIAESALFEEHVGPQNSERTEPLIGPEFGVLNGMYMTKEFQNAIKRLSGRSGLISKVSEADGLFWDISYALISLSHTSRAAKTILNPKTGVRNAIEEHIHAWINGWWSPIRNHFNTDMKQNLRIALAISEFQANVDSNPAVKHLSNLGFAGIKALFATNKDLKGVNVDEFIELWEEVAGLGLLSNSLQKIYDQEIAKLAGERQSHLDLMLQEDTEKIRVDPTVRVDSIRKKFRRAFSVLNNNKFVKAASRLYQRPSDSVRVMGYLKEKANIREAMRHELLEQGKTPAEVELMLLAKRKEINTQAANTVKDLVPTASRVTQLVKDISATPIVGNFPVWFSGYVRSMANQWKIGYKEATSKNKITKGIGIARLKRAFAVQIAIGTMARYIYSMLGWDDEDEEAMRNSMPVYQRNNTLIPIPNWGEEEGFSVWDATQSLPWLMGVDVFSTTKQGFEEGGISGALTAGMGQSLEMFIDEDIFLSSIMDMTWRGGETKFGYKIFDPLDSGGETVMKGVDHATIGFFSGGRGPLTPGVVPELSRIKDAVLAEETPSGIKRSIPGVLSRNLVGSEIVEFNPTRQLTMKVKEFNTEYTAIANSVRRAGYSSTSDEFKEKLDAFRAQNAKLYNEMNSVVHAARMGGMTDAEIDRVLNKYGVSKANRQHWIRDRVKDINLSDKTLRSILKSDDGPEKIKEYRKYKRGDRGE